MDAYSVFETGEHIRFQFRLLSVPDGSYRLKRYSITRESGSSYDKWMEIGAPQYLLPEEIRHITAASEPSCHASEVQASNGLRLEVTADPLEVVLITLQRQDAFPE